MLFEDFKKAVIELREKKRKKRVDREGAPSSGVDFTKFSLEQSLAFMADTHCDCIERMLIGHDFSTTNKSPSEDSAIFVSILTFPVDHVCNYLFSEQAINAFKAGYRIAELIKTD